MAIDAEKPVHEKTTLVMSMEKDQTAVFSGMIVTEHYRSNIEVPAADAPFDGLGANDKDQS